MHKKKSKEKRKDRSKKLWIKSSADKLNKNKTAKSSMFLPVFSALIAILAMAIISFIGITTAMNSSDKELFEPDFIRQNKPKYLPAVGESRKDNAPLENKMQAMLSIQQALAELQESKYTDQITAFAERLRLTDFAIIQASVNQDIDSDKIRLKEKTLEKSPHGEYYFQQLSILAPEDFILSLQNSLHTWKSGATLELKEKNRYLISLDDLPTHIIRIFQDPALFKNSLGPIQAPDFHDKSRFLPAPKRKEGSAEMVIVIDDLGASRNALDRLLKLNYPVTFAFWPYAANTKKGAYKAHAANKEIIVHLPMEPVGYPEVKPGDGALLLRMKNEEIAERTLWAIAQVPHATGLNNHMGSRLTQNKEKIGFILSILKSKKLFALDSLTHANSIFYSEAQKHGIPSLQRSVFIDVESEKKSVLRALNKAERIARLTGSSIAIGHPLPGTLDALEEWQRSRSSDVQLVRLKDLL